VTCAYLDQGVGSTERLATHYVDRGVGHGAPLNGVASERVVRENDLDKLTEIHSRDINLSYCLEYAVRLGRHRITSHLVRLGVPITRSALEAAADRRGPGMDLLLAGLKGEALARAQIVALGFRIAAGDFNRAYSMLEAGTKPDRNFIRSAYEGSLVRSTKRPWQPVFQETLDRSLPHITPEELAASDLWCLIECGRPVHIERTLEILQRPPASLLPRVMGLRWDRPLQALRAFGVPIDDAAFGICTGEMTSDCKDNFDQFLQRLCDCTLLDGYGGKISAQSIAPLFPIMLKRLSDFQDDLRRLMPCVKADERDALYPLVLACSDCEETTRMAIKDIDVVLGDISAFIEQPSP